MEKATSWLEKTLHYQFRDAELFVQAITHRSASGSNNERLEFLGDAVLDFVISDALFQLRPEADEGDLSKLRASLVKDTSLAELAVELGLGEHLILGSGERKTGGHRRESILADALEAILGAVYLDSGFDAAKDLVDRIFEQRLNALPDAGDLRDPKTRLQEWLQARARPLPVYALEREVGADHAKTFYVRCELPDDGFSVEASGISRRKAEQAAATAILHRLQES